jgi:uncharacterized protein YjbI with pentapeptide repeats
MKRGRWTTKAELQLVRDVLGRKRPLPTPADPDDRWVHDLLLQWFRMLWGRRRHRPGAREIGSASRRALRELQVFARHQSPGPDVLGRLEDTRFRGRREDLVCVLADSYGDALRRQRRRSRRVPDLRGANLANLNLGYIDFTGANLRGADLRAAIARVASFDKADLRDCEMRHADFSYAFLRHARLSRSKLYETMLVGADLSHADLRDAELLGTNLNEAKLGNANLSGSLIWGVSAWDIRTNEHTRQRYLFIAPGITADPNEWDAKRLRRSSLTVPDDNIEVAHFITMLVANPMIGRVLNAAADKIVLLLGRFTGREQRAVLDMLRDTMPEYGYVPVVFDFGEPQNRDTIETVAVLAGISSFVIANLSRPRSTPLEAQLIIPTIAVPFVPIVGKSERPFSMFAALERKYPWVLPVVTYADTQDLRRKLRRRIIEPAEDIGRKLWKKKHPDARLPPVARSRLVAGLRKRFRQAAGRATENSRRVP